ncbi:MAG TPA: nitrile hydratase subunit beta [Steroidobacteraceae bacterium]|nr:nitrile hydratase subunit beta [Steroidobacteraceae bacterium]
MNGIHDMGGMQDMGPIRPEKDEPVFHTAWEGRAFALDMAVDGDWTLNAERHQIELIPPADYLRMSYYEKWLTSLVELMVKTGLVTRAEVDSGTAIGGTIKTGHVLSVAEVPALIAPRPVASSDDPPAAHFQVGQHVRAKNVNPVGHTRLPRYARGKLGTIARDYGVATFPDTNAHGLGKKPQHVYSVRFPARELWGQQAGQRDSVYIDLWDDYLDSA